MCPGLLPDSRPHPARRDVFDSNTGPPEDRMVSRARQTKRSVFLFLPARLPKTPNIFPQLWHLNSISKALFHNRMLYKLYSQMTKFSQTGILHLSLQNRDFSRAPCPFIVFSFTDSVSSTKKSSKKIKNRLSSPQNLVLSQGTSSPADFENTPPPIFCFRLIPFTVSSSSRRKAAYFSHDIAPHKRIYCSFC